MSRTYSLLCNDCKESIWIAQGWKSMPETLTLYSGEKETMESLRDFLFTHEGHSLTFIDDERLDDDVKEVLL